MGGEENPLKRTQKRLQHWSLKKRKKIASFPEAAYISLNEVMAIIDILITPFQSMKMRGVQLCLENIPLYSLFSPESDDCKESVLGKVSFFHGLDVIILHRQHVIT